MTRNIYMRPYDLTSSDGKIVKITRQSSESLLVEVVFEDISSTFRGFYLHPELVKFNLKSTFAQLGVDSIKVDLEMSQTLHKATSHIELKAFNPIGIELLKYLQEQSYIGKLFAEDPERKVRNPEYLTRLLGKTDDVGNPLLLLSEEYKAEEIIHQPEKNRTIVRVPLRPGYWVYNNDVLGFIQTIAKGLCIKDTSFRKFLYLHQNHTEGPRRIPKNGMLLVKTMSMNMKTLFAKVAHDELPKGYRHACADIINPQIKTGDIFEFHGDSDEEITHVPLEFYTLEPFREHFFFSDRDLLRELVDDPAKVFNSFKSCPPDGKAATFIVKGDQMLNLSEKDWFIEQPFDQNLIVPPYTKEEKWILDQFIQTRSAYPILKAMQEDYITSQGIILSSHFLSPPLITFLLNERVTRSLKAIYFKTPSQKHGDFFSHDDRALLQELAKVSVDVFWVDFTSNMLLKYILRRDKDYGMFVPTNQIERFHKATFFGVYGSKFQHVEMQNELKTLFAELLQMKHEVDHVKLNKDTEIAISTGGGPGVMAMGNRIASELNIISCGHGVDFRKPHEKEYNIQEEMNPYIQAKMTYRLEHVITRQSEFNLDFPIFMTGGFGTDFELALEILRLQVGIQKPTPILLFGSFDYWKEKITATFQINQHKGTILGSEWISNCLYCVQNAKQALSVYYKYFTNRLEIGPNAKPKNLGFIAVDNDFLSLDKNAT